MLPHWWNFVRQSYLHPLFNLAVHRILYSFISIRYGVTLCRANYPGIISAPDRSACHCASTVPCALTLNSSVGRLPATASSGESAGRREAAWKAPVIAHSSQYNGCYSKFTQHLHPSFPCTVKKRRQQHRGTHIVRCQVWVQIVDA